MRKHLISLRRW